MRFALALLLIRRAMLRVLPMPVMVPVTASVRAASPAASSVGLSIF
jgi:hypothetical protein